MDRPKVQYNIQAIDGPRDGGFYLRADVDAYIAELEAKNRRMVELLKASVAEFDDGIKYPLEVVNDLKQVLASKEKDDANSILD